MANVTITQLPAAGPIQGDELVPIVQNGQTVRSTTAAVAGSPVQTQTFITLNQEPTLNNSRALAGGTGVGLVDNGAQSTLEVTLNGASGSLEAATTGVIVKTGSSTVTGRSIAVSGTGLSITNGSGVSGNPTISLSGLISNIAQVGGTGLLAIQNGVTAGGVLIAGTANQITVVNGNGLGGNPTLSIATNPVIPGTGGMKVPSGTTAQQPSGSDGQIRYNEDNDEFEGLIAGTWTPFSAGFYVNSFSAGTTGFTPSVPTTGDIVLDGVLNVSNGGTGATSLTGYLVGNGTSAFTAVATIPNAGLTNDSVTYNGVTVALGGSGTITAANPQALTIGTGLAGSSYDGSSAVTIAIDSTVATLTGSQSLTNKTISGALNTLTNIPNASLDNSAITINGSSVSLGGSVTVTATASNALTIGAGLSGTSYNGSTAVTIAIDSTVATLTGSQTLTNKSMSGLDNSFSNIPNVALSNSSVTINGSNVALGGSTTITAASPQALTIGTGLSGGSYDGSSAVTVAIDSTVATLTGTQTLTNKSISGATNTLSSIPNAALDNSSVTIGTTSVSLGGTSLTLGGLTSVAVTQDPVSALQVATKQYVDGLVSSGITFHAPVKYEVPSTTGNLNATYNQPGGPGVGVGATLTNAGTLAAFAPDGPTASPGDRVLIYNQTNAFENGVYTVTVVGDGSTAWVLTRATDADTYGLKSPNSLGDGDAFFIQSGNTGAGETYVCNTTGVITFGTTAITFVQVSTSQVYSAGTGLTLSGTQFSLSNTGTPGTYGSASQVPVITTNAQGQVTGVTNTSIAISGSAVTGDIAGNAANVNGVVAIANGGTGTTTPSLVAGTNVSITGTWPNQTINSTAAGGVTSFSAGSTGLTPAVATSGAVTLGGTLSVASGGTGTSTPGLVAGTNVTITGAWPNQTISASGGGGGSTQIGEIYLGTNAPSTGTWLETGKYYSKSTYSALAAAIGDVADYKSIQVPQSNLYPGTFPNSARTYRIYSTATNGTITVMIGSGGFKYTTDGLNWTPVIYGATGTPTFQGIEYLNGRFVAFGSSGAVVYSTDGISWKSSFIPGGNPIQGMAFGAGVYVSVNNGAASQSSGIWYSSDLITWTQPIPTLLVNFSQVVYGNGVFVACGVGGFTYSSPDGINWTLRTAGIYTINDVVFINNEFVQVGNSGSYYRSANGTSWSSVAIGAVNLMSVIFENGIYVLFGDGCSIYTSTDGVTYTQRLSGYSISGTSFSIRAVVWNGTNFVAVANNAGIWFSGSSDGVTWTSNVDSFGAQFVDAAVIAGNTLAIGFATIRVAGGPRAIVMCSSWQVQLGILNSAFLPSPQMIAYDSGLNRYVAAATNGVIYYSSDAITWTAAPIASPAIVGASCAVAENGRFFVLSTSATATNFLTSANGINWTPISLGVASAIVSVAYGAGVWVAVGQNRILSSPDGTTWTARVTTGNFTSVIFANGLFVTVGQAGVCQTSPDGITWTSRSLGAGSVNMWKVVYDNSLYVAIGNSGNVSRSSDGITWFISSFGSFNGYWITRSAPLGLWCVVGTTGGIATSPDAATWTLRSNNGETTNTYYTVFWESGKFYIGGSSNYRSSTDGIIWLRESSALRGSTFYMGYAGGKFLMTGSSNIQSSTDGNTWQMANNVNPGKVIASTPNRFYKLGGYYYGCSTNQTFISSDGITFQVGLFQFNGARAMAYSGSVWVMAVPAPDNFIPNTVYRSTDGVNWSKAASFGQRIFVTGTPPGIIGLVYASGRFVLAFDSQNSVNGLESCIYTSADGLTWTPVSVPTAFQPRGLDSDGTTIVLSSTNNYQLFKSVDGGLSWDLLSLAAGEVTYTGGIWVFAHPTSPAISFVSTDLVTFKGLGLPATATTAYSKNGYLSLFASTIKFFARNDNPAFVAESIGGSLSTGFTNIGSFYAEAIERGNTLLVPSGTLENRYPWLAAEIPAFSYNTSTTFWVPPYAAGGGQKAWIYAGP